MFTHGIATELLHFIALFIYPIFKVREFSRRFYNVLEISFLGSYRRFFENLTRIEEQA